MKISLPINNFSFFKVATGTLFLFGTLIFPVALYVPVIILIVGKAHSLGAWMAIWRAGKFTWVYFLWVLIITGGVSFWGSEIAPLATLAFVGYTLFAFHFLFDEFDLQEEVRDFGNVLSSIIPFILTFLFLLNHFFNLHIPLTTFLVIAGVILIPEVLLTKEITWFFIHTKILTLFIICSIFLGSTAITLLNILLVFHYFFWFIYPVYKLHKYKRAERDGFIMMLLIIMIMSIFIYSTKIWGAPEIMDIAMRTFFIASIAHILTTAPFGYLLGLPKPKKYVPIQS